MHEVVQHATTDELNLLMDTITDCETVTEARADLLFAIVDELTKRGEISKTPDDEVKTFIEQIMAKALEQPDGAAKQEHPLAKHIPQILEDAKRDRAERRQRRIALLRMPIAAASMIVILLLTNVVSLAAGYDFFGSVAQWSKDAVFFAYGSDSAEEPKQEMSKEYYSLKMTLDTLGIQVDLPKHMPGG